MNEECFVSEDYDSRVAAVQNGGSFGVEHFVPFFWREPSPDLPRPVSRQQLKSFYLPGF